MKQIAQLTALITLLLLGACVPTANQASDPNSVVLVNGPTENAVAGLADELARQLAATPGCCAFDIHWSAPVRAQERQRDLYSDRAWGSAARIARSLGAGWAVLVGVNDFERTVTERNDRLDITVSTGVRVHVLDRQGSELASFDSRTLTDSRSQPSSQPLVDERQEPLRQALAQQALRDVASALASELDWLAGGVLQSQRK